MAAVTTGALGDGTNGFLSSLGSGGANDLSSGNLGTAQKILDKAVRQVSQLRGRIGAFQTFAQIHLLTRGGPAGATNVVVYSIYRDAFFNFQTGYASAQAVILFLILLALTAIQFGVLERRVYYS